MSAARDERGSTPRLRVLCSPALEHVLRRNLLSVFEGRFGCRCELVVATSGDIMGRLVAGVEVADVVIAASGPLRSLCSRRGVGPVREVARAHLGLATTGVRPLCRTPQELRSLLLGARSVAYSAGMSGRSFMDVVSELGVRDVVVRAGSLVEHGPTAAALFDGRADVAVQQVSELMGVCDRGSIGVFPTQVQRFSDLAAVAWSRARGDAMDTALLMFLGSLTAGRAIEAAGLLGPLPAAGQGQAGRGPGR
jgi:molybdate transport system substrate-binding protein